MQILQEKHTKSTSRLTCQQDNLNPPTFYLTVSYSAQQLASIWHCRPQACLLYFSIQFVPSQIGKAWPRFLLFQPLMHLLFDLHPGNINNHLIYMIQNKKNTKMITFFSLSYEIVQDQYTQANFGEQHR
jgi:hypothetical protein